MFEHKRLYRIITEFEELLGSLAGKIHLSARMRDDLPAVGDSVVLRLKQRLRLYFLGKASFREGMREKRMKNK